jgi:hypothetical protein
VFLIILLVLGYTLFVHVMAQRSPGILSIMVRLEWEAC